MSKIDDDGKIWLRGFARPEYGVRVGNLYFVTGKEDAEIIKLFIHYNFLYVDLHNSECQYRIIRRFDLDLEPRCSGTLFSGFKKTKHADIKAVTYRDTETDEFRIDGEKYQLNSESLIDPVKLIQLTGWK